MPPRIMPCPFMPICISLLPFQAVAVRQVRKKTPAAINAIFFIFKSSSFDIKKILKEVYCMLIIKAKHPAA
jgi:hypothetical protein